MDAARVTAAYWSERLAIRASAHGATSDWWQLSTMDLRALVQALNTTLDDLAAARAEVQRLSNIARSTDRT